MKRARVLAATGFLWVFGCFTDSPAGGGGTGDPACTQGAVGCACYPNDTCDATLTCFPDGKVCIPDNCSPVVAGCPCPIDGCGDGLVCDGPVCIASGAQSSAGSDSVGSSDSTISTTQAPGTTGDEPTETSLTLYFSSSEMPFASGLGPAASRTEGQRLCDTSMADADPSCVRAAAIFSTGEGDTVLDLPQSSGMPFSVPVTNYLGETIAPSFQDLLDNGSMMSLQNWNVSLADMPGEVPAFFWTGTDKDGAAASDCMGWTRVDPPDQGKGGLPVLSDPIFWLTNNDYPCRDPAPLLCACWD